MQRVVVLAIVVCGVFALLESGSGDAADAYLAEIGSGNAQFAAELRARFGLDGTMPERFLRYLGRVFTLDFGESVTFSRPVVEVVAERVPVTLALSGTALLCSAGLGSLLGVAVAHRRGGLHDRVITPAVLLLNATPGFFLALLAILLFVVELRWLPLAGMASDDAPASGMGRFVDRARHLALPVAVLTLTYLALYQRVARSAVAEALGGDAVLGARARHVTPRRVFWGYAVRPALLSVITLIGLHAGALLGGSVAIETVFALPGLGSLALEAVVARDVWVLAAVLLLCTLLVLVVNTVVDLSYRWLDPRTRVGEPAT